VYSRRWSQSWVRSLRASDVGLAGRRVEVSWVAFRIVHFPGMDDLEAAGELGAWARRCGVGVDFQERKVKIGSTEHDVLFVLFAAG
jgi:hypothetical protein